MGSGCRGAEIGQRRSVCVEEVDEENVGRARVWECGFKHYFACVFIKWPKRDLVKMGKEEGKQGQRLKMIGLCSEIQILPQTLH